MSHDHLSPRRDEETSFLLDIIDDRHLVMDLLKTKFSFSDVLTSDYTSKSQLPDFCSEFVDTSRPIDFSLATSVQRSADDREAIGTAFLKVIPEDRLPFIITNDHGLVTIEQGDLLLIDAEGKVFRQVLEGLFARSSSPAKLSRLSDLQLLDIILSLSPVTQRFYQFDHVEDGEKVTIQAIENESETDSVHSLCVEILRPHASNAKVGTCLTVRESLEDRTSSSSVSSTDHSTDIIAIYNDLAEAGTLTVEDFFRGDGTNKRVPVRTITRYHMSDVYDALSTLRRAQP